MKKNENIKNTYSNFNSVFVKTVVIMLFLNFLFFGNHIQKAQASTPTPILDLDASTLGLSNNASVTDWTNSGIDFTQATGVNQPTYKAAGLNGHPSVHFDGANTYLTSNSASLASSMKNGSFTIIIAFQEGGAGLYTLFAKNPGGGDSFPWILLNGGTGIYRWSDLNVAISATAMRNSQADMTVGTPEILTYKFTRADSTNGTETFYLNGFRIMSRTGSIPTWNDVMPFSIGGTGEGSASYIFNGDISRVQIYNSDLSTIDRTNVENSIRSSLGLSPLDSYTQGVNIFFSGNSLVDTDVGTGAEVTEPLYIQTINLLNSKTGNNYRGINIGRNGFNWSQLIGLIPGNAGLLEPGDVNILYAYEDTNTLASTLSTATTQSEAASFYSQETQAGFNVIGTTELPTGFLADDSLRTSLNTLRKQPDSNRILLDLANDPTIGLAGENNNTTYYIDGTHLTNAGYGVIAGYLETSLEKIVNPSTLLTNVASTPSSTSVNINWATDFNSSSKIDFGLDNSYGTNTTESDTGTRVLNHTVTVSNLIPCSLYHYQTESKDFAGNDVTSADQNFITNGCTGNATVSNSNSNTITTVSGGSLSLSDLSLSVPIAFSNTSTSANFQIKQLDSGSFFATANGPIGKTRIGTDVFDLKALSDTATTISTFSQPLTVTLTYSPSDVANIDTTSLKIYRYDGSAWTPLTNCVVNTSVHTVTCQTNNFSDFALFGNMAAPPFFNSGGPLLTWPTPTTVITPPVTPVITINPPTTQTAVTTPTLIIGCGERITGFSTSTGQSCIGNTAAVINTTYNFGTEVLKNGSVGNAVIELQKFLNKVLNLNLVIDGRLGPKTIAAVKKWQKDNGLVVDGIIGAKTREKMLGVK